MADPGRQLLQLLLVLLSFLLPGLALAPRRMLVQDMQAARPPHVPQPDLAHDVTRQQLILGGEGPGHGGGAAPAAGEREGVDGRCRGRASEGGQH